MEWELPSGFAIEFEFEFGDFLLKKGILVLSRMNNTARGEREKAGGG